MRQRHHQGSHSAYRWVKLARALETQASSAISAEASRRTYRGKVHCCYLLLDAGMAYRRAANALRDDDAQELIAHRNLARVVETALQALMEMKRQPATEASFSHASEEIEDHQRYSSVSFETKNSRDVWWLDAFKLRAILQVL